jgi:hypothetical protein
VINSISEIVQSGGKLVTFQKILLVLAVISTVGAILILTFWQEEMRDYNVLLMLVAVTFGVVGFSSLDHENDN